MNSAPYDFDLSDYKPLFIPIGGSGFYAKKRQKHNQQRFVDALVDAQTGNLSPVARSAYIWAGAPAYWAASRDNVVNNKLSDIAKALTNTKNHSLRKSIGGKFLQQFPRRYLSALAAAGVAGELAFMGTSAKMTSNLVRQRALAGGLKEASEDSQAPALGGLLGAFGTTQLAGGLSKYNLRSVQRSLPDMADVYLNKSLSAVARRRGLHVVPTEAAHRRLFGAAGRFVRDPVYINLASMEKNSPFREEIARLRTFLKSEGAPNKGIITGAAAHGLNKSPALAAMLGLEAQSRKSPVLYKSRMPSRIASKYVLPFGVFFSKDNERAKLMAALSSAAAVPLIMSDLDAAGQADRLVRHAISKNRQQPWMAQIPTGFRKGLRRHGYRNMGLLALPWAAYGGKRLVDAVQARSKSASEEGPSVLNRAGWGAAAAGAGYRAADSFKHISRGAARPVLIPYGYTPGLGGGHVSQARKYETWLRQNGIAAEASGLHGHVRKIQLPGWLGGREALAPNQLKKWRIPTAPAARYSAVMPTGFGLDQTGVYSSLPYISVPVDYTARSTVPALHTDPIARGPETLRQLRQQSVRLSKELGFAPNVRRVITLGAGEAGTDLLDKVRLLSEAAQRRKDVGIAVMAGNADPKTLEALKALNPGKVRVLGAMPNARYQDVLSNSWLNLGYAGSSSVTEQLNFRNPQLNTLRSAKSMNAARNNLEFAKQYGGIDFVPFSERGKFVSSVLEALDNPKLRGAQVTRNAEVVSKAREQFLQGLRRAQRRPRGGQYVAPAATALLGLVAGAKALRGRNEPALLKAASFCRLFT